MTLAIIPSTDNDLATITSLLITPMPGSGVDGLLHAQFQQVTETATHRSHIGVVREEQLGETVEKFLAEAVWSPTERGWVSAAGGGRELKLAVSR